MRIIKLGLIIMFAWMPGHFLMGQVNDKMVQAKDTLYVSRDSMVRLIRIKDSILHQRWNDSVMMSKQIVMLEYYRDSLYAALNQSIYRQKLDSANRMRKFLNYRDYNRRSRQELYGPIGLIDTDSVRSSMKRMVDLVFEDTAYTPRPKVLRSYMDQLVDHLVNDSIYIRMVNTNQDTIPFVLKKGRADSTAFFVMNSYQDSAKLFIRSLDKYTMSVWVGDDLNLKHLLKKQGPPQELDIKWQGKNQFRVARIPVPVPPPKFWFLRSELGLMINQVTFANWAKGGNNSIALSTEVKAWANYAKGNIKWDNYFWFQYGVQKTELLSIRKSQDRINLVSNLSHKALKRLDYTVGTTFETQGFKGFAYPNDSIPVSKFMSPADLKLNLGFTFKPNPTLTLNLFPVGGMLRFVTDTVLIDQTKYGVKEGKRMMAQLGARVILNHKLVITKDIIMDNYLDLYSNYIDHPEKVNFDWRFSLSLKVNKYISTSIKTELMYDNKVLVPIFEVTDGKKVKVGEGKRVQFNEILGVTFKYTMY